MMLFALRSGNHRALVRAEDADKAREAMARLEAAAFPPGAEVDEDEDEVEAVDWRDYLMDWEVVELHGDGEPRVLASWWHHAGITGTDNLGG